MANSKHLKILQQGVAAWNAWRSANPYQRPDLRGADLSCADLKGADLNSARLHEANLGEANLKGAELYNADLTAADLSLANLNNANLHNADLTGAALEETQLKETDLTQADLTFCNLRNAVLNHAVLNYAIFTSPDLEGADFTDARLGNTMIADVDFSPAIGLEWVQHDSPSSIGIDTLYKSQGKIPEVFLRGCGVPDRFILQVKALIGAEEGIQFYSCFISYSGLDDDFARRLHGRLQQDHVRVWFAPHDIQGGKKVHEQIDEAIRVYDKLLIILSPHSLKSDWVMTELRKARKAERKTGKRKLFPVRLVDYDTLREWECFDSDGGQDLAVEVREYFIPDFTHWKDHDAFETAYARLLKDLRAATRRSEGA